MTPHVPSELNNSRATALDDYLKSHAPAKLSGRIEIYSLDGKRRELEVYRLPLDKLYYNIRNGRFAAQLAELEAKEGRHLDPLNKKDAEKIELLLLSDADKTEWLRKDLKRVGQLQPGAITWDGAIINGNRRFAVLSELKRETGNEAFGFLEAVRLPRTLSPKDLWRIEAGLQLAVDLTEAYGPVNELLKIKEGLDYGLSRQEIALTLGGDNTAVVIASKVELLALIEDYLRFTNRPRGYPTPREKWSTSSTYKN